ncbi:hypothetical protein EU803_15215 [Loktanella sp. IMCC34160]|uniref:hypothetical protein n=1 Tax=Loktanella sp. IMCC34160 TaxID=2510646 RepID=UPI00101D8520|nr:hypothetical protein [Loktanella sp. IMCC34160]RYG89966.1 hypothetical protein EU803_15215 [Loktanella sp. IMCC34160]
MSMLTGSDSWRHGEDQPEMIGWISWATHHLNKATDPAYFSRVIMPMFDENRRPEAEIEHGLED